jgi:hypothetical protein
MTCRKLCSKALNMAHIANYMQAYLLISNQKKMVDSLFHGDVLVSSQMTFPRA